MTTRPASPTPRPRPRHEVTVENIISGMTDVEPFPDLRHMTTDQITTVLRRLEYNRTRGFGGKPMIAARASQAAGNTRFMGFYCGCADGFIIMCGSYDFNDGLATNFYLAPIENLASISVYCEY